MSGGTVPFRLWPAQVMVMWQLMTLRLVIILKARQLGISWLCCSYALWCCLFKDGQVVLLFSKGQDEADTNLKRVLKLYERLPDWMRAALPVLLKQNTTELEWANGSRVKSQPATRNAGRSETASVAIWDETAFMIWASDLYTAMKPTIDGGGQLIMLSTANGLGNLFHQIWTKATAGLSTFTTIFLPWWSRPGRDAAWYAAMLADHPDPPKVKQEYPASATEAFVASGRARFDADWIAAQAANVRPPLPSSAIPDKLRGVPGLAVYTLPVRGRRYIVGGDVAEGLEHGDFSSGTLIDAQTWEEMACLHGHWEPDVFAGYLDTLATVYDAEIAVERNNHGHAVIVALKTLRSLRKVVRGNDGKYGWLTNVQTKPLMIDLLARALHTGLAKVRSQAALDEMQIYAVGEGGTTGAPTGYHDDRVMSWAIAIAIAGRPSKVGVGF